MSIPAQLIETIRTADKIVALTGAGVSAESGVPTFRDALTGLWANFKPEELATPTAFRKNPKLVWDWYAWRRDLVASVRPNPAHIALAEMERRFSDFQLITQNVDGLHQRAGSKRVIELHGNITRTKCFAEDKPVASWDESSGVPPKCPRCGGLLRPDVVWFDEALPEAEIMAAYQASKACDVFLSIGTSGVVYPAAELPFEALKTQAMVIEINPQPTPLTPRADYSLPGPAGVILPELLACLGS